MIKLGVSDLERSIEFYQIGLDVPRDDSPPEIAFFSLTGSWFGLYSRDSLAKEAGVLPRSAGFAGISLAHNVASESEVDAVIALALAVGATVTKEAGRMHWGGYSGYFSDPDGYFWEIAHNPFLWIGPTDA